MCHGNFISGGVAGICSIGSLVQLLLLLELLNGFKLLLDGDLLLLLLMMLFENEEQLLLSDILIGKNLLYVDLVA